MRLKGSYVLFYLSSTIFFILIGIDRIFPSINTLILSKLFLKAIRSLIFLLITL